jgi:hypothetical protein
MSERFLIFLLILTAVISSCNREKEPRWCPVQFEDYIYMDKPFMSHSGGVNVFDYNFLIDFREIAIPSFVKNDKLDSILMNGASILKDSNDVKVFLFYKKDTIIIEEDEIKSENAIMILCKKKSNTKHDTTNK